MKFTALVTVMYANKLQILHIVKYDDTRLADKLFTIWTLGCTQPANTPAGSNFGRFFSKNFVKIYTIHHGQQNVDIAGGLRANADMYSPGFVVDIYGPKKHTKIHNR